MENIHLDDPNVAIGLLKSRIKEVVRHLKGHGENPLNHLVLRPGWERQYKGKWPDRYEGKVGNVLMCYAVEDRTQWGPHQLRFKARVLSVCYVDVDKANKGEAIQRPVYVPKRVARVIANGFFIGEVQERLEKDTGDWKYIQIFGKEQGHTQAVILTPDGGVVFD